MAAVGFWDGHQTGEGVASTLHYGKSHSFGYILLVYALASSETFAPGNLFLFMNLLGFWATVLCLPLLWLALVISYGRKIAWSATAIFIGSPVFLEVAGGSHPVLLALAVLFLGTILLWYPARGAVALLLKLLAVPILFFALTLRLEVVLAFPLLVLAPTVEPGKSSYLHTCLIRLAATVAACLCFVFAQSRILVAGEGKTAVFFTTWYSWDNIPVGFVALVLAVGLASIFALAWISLNWVRSVMRNDRSFVEYFSRAMPMLGPLAVFGVTFVFWIANPLPARHFLLSAFSTAIIIAVVMISKLQRKRTVVITVCLVIAANQFLSAAVNSYIVEASGFTAHRGWPYLLTAPSGFSWERRAMLKEKWAGSLEAGRIIASGRCGDRVIVSAPLSSAVIAQLVNLQPNQTVSSRVVKLGQRNVSLTEVKYPVHALVYARGSMQDRPFPPGLIDIDSLSSFQFAIISDTSIKRGQLEIFSDRFASERCLMLDTANSARPANQRAAV